MENGDLPAHAFGLFSLVRKFLAASRSIRMASRSLALSASWSHSAALVRNSSALHTGFHSVMSRYNTKERTPFKSPVKSCRGRPPLDKTATLAPDRGAYYGP
jgi:hypothetical protein